MEKRDLRKLIKRNISSILVVAVILSFFIVGFGSSILEIIRLSQLKSSLSNEIVQGQEQIDQLNEGATRFILS